MFQIGVITPQSSINLIQKIEPLINDKCELYYLTYNNTKEIRRVYLENYLFFDGIVFSGAFSYSLIKEDFKNFHIPTTNFDISEKDFYKCLFKVMVENKNLDTSRIFVDFLFEDNNFLGLKEILDNEKFPIYHSEHETIRESVCDRLFSQHLSLWEEGKIDMSITRMSGVGRRLKKYGFNHEIVFASVDSMLEKLNYLIKEIELARMLENQVVVGNISIVYQDTDPSISDLETHQKIIKESLIRFGESKNLSLVIQKKHLGFECIISYRDLKEITNDFTCCAILNDLNNKFSFKINIGWGIGNTIYEARNRAENANKESKICTSNASYIVTENDEVIGPLGEETCLIYSNTSEPSIQRISDKTGISPLQIQKILAVISKLQTNELSSEDIAVHLGVTIRSANRILNRLEEKGLATVSYKQQKKLRGRPKKFLKINFNQVLIHEHNKDTSNEEDEIYPKQISNK